MLLPFLKTKKSQVELSNNSRIPKKKESLQALWRLVQIMLSNLEFEDVSEKVVNSILDELGYLKLGYKIIVLALANKSTGYLERFAISQTAEARKALVITPVPFREIKIPLNDLHNLSIKAMRDGKPYYTHDWYDILRPVYTPAQAKEVQETVGIKTSVVYPLFFKKNSTGTLIFSMDKDYEDVTEEEKDLLIGFVDLVGLTVQDSILYTILHSTTSKLQEANNRLKELDELKDEFVSVTSHELRTPMTAIRSYAWMALHRSDMPLSKTMEKYIVRILISAERMINLVSDMLNISRIESGRIEINPEPLDLILLCRDILDEVYYSKAMEKNIQFQLLEQQIPKVFADPEKLRQVLLNIVGNALKFSPLGGKITIGFFTDGKVVETYLKDQGPGISQEDMGKLFQKFGRLDNSYTATATSGGTGLGLYISRSLIELMHGRIWAISEGVGKGATFTFALPVASEQVLKEADKYTVKPRGEAKGLEPVAI